MAAVAILLPHSYQSISSLSTSINTRRYFAENQSWQRRMKAPCGKAGVVRASIPSSTAAHLLDLNHFHQPTLPFPLFLIEAVQIYSLTSYYTSLGLFVIAVPGLWSLIKRSVKSKVIQKTFIVSQNGKEAKKAVSQVAGEILSFFTRNNFVVMDRGEVITFEGIMSPSRGQAAFLTFCTFIGLASVALVLSIVVPDLGDNCFWLTLLSPLAGVYYWKRASRKEQIKVKIVIDEADESLQEVIVEGDDQQVEQLRKEVELSEKGMVYVKGILER